MFGTCLLSPRSLMACLLAFGWTASVPAQDQIPWAPNFETARQLSVQQQLPILVHFSSGNCVPCRIVERDVFTQAPVGAALQQMCIPVKVDAEQNMALAQQLGVDRWPTDVVLAPDGRILGKQVSAQDPREFVQRIMHMLGQLPGQQIARQLETRGPVPPPGVGGAEVQPVAYAPPQAAAPSQPAAGPASDPMLPPNGSYQTAGPPPTVGPPAYASGFPSSVPYAPAAGPSFPAGASQPSFPHAPNNFGHQPVSNEAPVGISNDSQVVDNPYARAGGQASPPQGALGAPVLNGPHYAAGATASAPPPSNYRPYEPGPATAETGPPAGAGGYTPPTTSTAQGGWGYGPSAPSYVEPGRDATPTTTATPNQYANAPASHQPTTPGATMSAQQAGSSSATGGGPVNPATGKRFGLDGYCPVTLADERRWAEGDPRWGATHRGRIYLFATEGARQRFMANPDSFSPMLAGFDPVAYVENGAAIEGERAHGLVFRNQIFLFSSEDHLNRFWQNPDRYEGMVLQAMGGSRPGDERVVR